VEAALALKSTLDQSATLKGALVFKESEIITEEAEERTQTNPDPNAPDSCVVFRNDFRL
jgi:hypothetical protein